MTPLPAIDIRPEHRLIADLVPANASILDIGCGSGDLLAYLQTVKGIDGRGMEISQKGVNACVQKGLYVVQGDADNDLSAFGDNRFDYVILSQTLQAVFRPETVLRDLVRIGRKAIITIPNFGFWGVRAHLLLKGRMPVTKSLPKSWYQTDNIHLCTIADMMGLIGDLNLTLHDFAAHQGDGQRLLYSPKSANWRARFALFVVSRS